MRLTIPPKAKVALNCSNVWQNMQRKRMTPATRNRRFVSSMVRVW